MQNIVLDREILTTTYMDNELKEYDDNSRKITNIAIQELFNGILDNVVSSFEKI